MVEDHRTVGYGYGLVLCSILVVYNHFKWDTWDMGDYPTDVWDILDGGSTLNVAISIGQMMKKTM